MGFLTGFAQKGVCMILLQVLRVFTLIGLASVMAASWALAIKIDLDKPYFVFDAASLVFMSGIALFLALSELPFAFCQNFFEMHWPAFSRHSGLGWLGLALIMIGCNTLGKLNNSKTDPEDIGMPWWQLVLASGILNLIFGVFNVVATWALHDYQNGNNVRVIRANGADASAGTLPRSIKSEYAGSGSIQAPKKALWKRLWDRDSGKETTRPKITHYGPEAHTNENIDRARESSSSAPDGYNSPRHEHDTNNNDARSSLQMSPIDPTVPRPRFSQHPIHKSDKRPTTFLSVSRVFRPQSRTASSFYDLPPHPLAVEKREGNWV
ncbi:hypothetical protein ACRE_007570 [Hapsidospora chrysogenum ATCC 11550]|uniref:DUF7598 domain-containing protein n=1 Tax=Hapsidospora chrysogenum (strain ATCC 11550 / CBS 779.69 / DSM 880 / IAM 14645 / JCM 23072 / IMI 49137) TaxID=857340 RepID=A0A086TG23_HAPC1|nr:hypothetical protein ACRE_007570 [Hapsidospora chrysogenum ATCC 11550]